MVREHHAVGLEVVIGDDDPVILDVLFDGSDIDKVRVFWWCQLLPAFSETGEYVLRQWEQGMIATIDPTFLIAAAECHQRIEFESDRFDFAQFERPGLCCKIAEGGKTCLVGWIVVADEYLFEQERLLAQAYERWFLLTGVAPVIIHQRLVEQGKEFSQQQRDANGIRLP